VAEFFTRNISATMRDRGVVSKDHSWVTMYWESNDHVTDDVTSYLQFSNLWFPIDGQLLPWLRRYKASKIVGVIIDRLLETINC